MLSCPIAHSDSEPQRHSELGWPSYAEALKFLAEPQAVPMERVGRAYKPQAPNWASEDSFERRINHWRISVASAQRSELYGPQPRVAHPNPEGLLLSGAAEYLHRPLPPLPDYASAQSLRRDSSPTSGARTSGLSSPAKIFAKLGHIPSEKEKAQITRAYERLTGTPSEDRRS